jgi:hypothetical protein
MKLNTNETIEWNSPLRVGVSSKFYFISYDMVILKTTLWNSPLRLILSGWNTSALFSKYECVGSWTMKPPLRLTLVVSCHLSANEPHSPRNSRCDSGPMHGRFLFTKGLGSSIRALFSLYLKTLRPITCAWSIKYRLKNN